MDLKNNNIPLNGRIAIVDDNVEQALPLMEFFGRMQYPYLYYSGDPKGLPDDGKAFNDIRILFLDINLTGDDIKRDKDLKSKLISVLNRIISENNYPYILVYWSRNEKEYAKLVDEIFRNELNKKAPINILSIRKSDYFELSGDKTLDFDENITTLFARIDEAISKYSVFKYLLNWENLIHISADKTLEEIFYKVSNSKVWDKNSKFLFYKLSKSFAGKSFDNITTVDQIRSAFYSLNFVLEDSLEYSILTLFEGEFEALVSLNEGNLDTLYHLNKKILLSDGISDKYLPGIVFELKQDSKSDIEKHNYKDILNNWIDREEYYSSIEKEIRFELKGLNGQERKSRKHKLLKDKLSNFRKIIRSDWKKVEVNVTPICDYVQGKFGYLRFIPGLLINSNHILYFNKSSDAVFISPTFRLSLASTEKFFLLLDFRFFTSISKEKIDDLMSPSFRIRQSLLSEVQSKLSRHINRQGILFLEE